MHVVATAGHVDHGKSALVRALTGTDPDRLEEEKRRGLSIQLGYAWTSLPHVGDVAFVDVPGHERFVSTMLAGVGPVPAVLFVVAADDPWMPQAAEHLTALDGLGVRHGVVAVTRADLVDPAPALARAATEIRRTSLRDAPLVAVSSRTGQGVAELRALLTTMLAGLPQPDPEVDVRLWVDRRFTVSGTGTVVTGTLPSGTVSRGDTLSTGTATVRVRGVESLGRSVASASGVARVALNLVGDVAALERAGVLTTPDAFLWTSSVDVRVKPDPARLPELPMLHLGSVSLQVRCRPLADDLVRLTLSRPLPLRVGDRALLRDPGSRAVWGVQVLDPLPPTLHRRGAARERARVLRASTGEPDLVAEVTRREVVDRHVLRTIGVADTPEAMVAADVAGVVGVGSWLVSPVRGQRVHDEVLRVVAEHDAARPLDRGLPLTVLADRLRLPSPDVVAAVLRSPLHVQAGRVHAPGQATLTPDVEQALTVLTADLTAHPFAAPTADRLKELGLDLTSLAAATKAGRLLRLAPGIVLLPGADAQAVIALTALPQPFTTSEARSSLGTSRRVVLPLLEHLDRSRLTRRLPDDRRCVVAPT